ncbi:MAG: malto-oligosyltrehalose trehalohydrolase [Gammaproteobacteria bacterium]
MKRSHRMPFGAEFLDDGQVRFRLWAPAASRVEVCLEDSAGERLLPMARTSDGWFEGVTGEAHGGSLYQYCLDGGQRVPDPASRFQPRDVHGPSEVIDPKAWEWRDATWLGRPWEESVFYELHVGAFSPQGSFAAVQERLDYLVDLGVTAVELMPIADFPGRHNWGYDGVSLFAPESRYGRPEHLKALVQAAHDRGLMVFLDVVYNHFGPEGNYLHLYAPQFFTERYHTPWGAAINFDGEGSQVVRDFFIHNALYWLEEFHFDGLRLDAVHAILDDRRPNILQELAGTVRQRFPGERRIHLVLENDHNAAHYLARDARRQPRFYVAQWNDDLHHALHVLTTEENHGYYVDYADAPLHHLGRCLTEGFAYQGERSAFRDGALRGESSCTLPLSAFVAFLQNHDQVGNRAFGERLTQLASPAAHRAAAAILLLAPSPPLLFMGQEYAAPEPFPFFCDLGADLAPLVTDGRRREFAQFPEFSDPASREKIPDPCDPGTFSAAILDWSLISKQGHKEWLQLYRELLTIRRRELVERIGSVRGVDAGFHTLDERGLQAAWDLGGGASLTLVANLGETSVPLGSSPLGRLLYTTHTEDAVLLQAGKDLPSWFVAWFLDVPNNSA